MTDGELTAAASGVFAIGRTVAVTRLGLGTMRLPGRRGSWADAASRAAAVQLLRRAADLGVDFLETADSYGPCAAEELIREALHPYRGITVATGACPPPGAHPAPGAWPPPGAGAGAGAGAGGLRLAVESSLRRLGLDAIDLYQLRADPAIPAADQLGALHEMRQEGKIRHIGLCGVAVDDIREARLAGPVGAVTVRYHVADRSHEPVLDYCEREGIGFIACSPLGPAAGRRSAVPRPLAQLARAAGVSVAQLSLAWLLRRSPVIMPVPGTGSLPHLEENVAAADLELADDELAVLSDLAE